MSTSTPQYYFACSYPLAPGAIILPGNWGRIIAMYNTSGFGNAWTTFREDVFEKVRSDEFAGKPSRLKSIFLCESLQALHNFLKETKRTLDLSYEVSLLDPQEPVHRGCLTFLDFQQKEGLDSFTLKARDYWSSTGMKKPEVITTSRVQILAQL